MPANKKYLTSKKEGWLRGLFGLFGGLIGCLSLHLFIASFFKEKNYIIGTSIPTIFLGWVGIMLHICITSHLKKTLYIYTGLTLISVLYIQLITLN